MSIIAEPKFFYVFNFEKPSPPTNYPLVHDSVNNIFIAYYYLKVLSLFETSNIEFNPTKIKRKIQFLVQKSSTYYKHDNAFYQLIVQGPENFIHYYYTKYPTGTHITGLPLFPLLPEERFLCPSSKPISAATVIYALYLVLTTKYYNNKIMFGHAGELFFINGENFYHIYYYLLSFSLV